MFNKGDIVLIIGSRSVPSDYLGRFGIVTEVSDFKCTVMLTATVGGTGSLSHTVVKSELLIVGKTTFLQF